MTGLQDLLDKPRPGITLDELAKELNALAKIRDSARVAFCQRLAIAYLMIVGHRPKGGPGNDGAPFYQWCADRIRAANGARYSPRTLKHYVGVGFSKNPALAVERQLKTGSRTSEDRRTLGSAIYRAVRSEYSPKPVSVTRLRTEHKMPSDVATEVNRLMTAWEQASPTARAQFIYMVTGKRLNAA